MGCRLEGSCRLVSLSQNGLSSHSLALAGDTSKRLCAPFREPRRTSLYSEEKEPSGAGMGFPEDGACLGWSAFAGVAQSSGRDPAWHQGSRPEDRSRGREGWACVKTMPRLPLGSARKPVLHLGNQVLGTAKPLPAQGRWEARVEGAPPRQTKPGLKALIAWNELFAVPGVGEDEPVIIFKFAIIDLGKSYCDKNELIIKFISEINSAAIKQLAGAAGAVCCPAFLAAKSPRQAPAGSAGGRGVGHNNYTFSRAPVPRGAEGAGCSPAGGGREPALGPEA